MRTALAIGALAIGLQPAAACPIELAVYRDRDNVAGIDFRPAEQSATVTNQFSLILARGLVLSGMVMWSEGLARPIGMLQHDCPEGDATGPEMEACTVWQGVVYTADDNGKAGFLPRQGEPAPKSIILADLAFDMSVAEALDGKRPDPLPSDIFELSGCQE